MKKAIVDGKITFTFDGLDPVVFDHEKVSDKMRDAAETHGWLARLGDNAAISRKQKDGTIINVTEEMRRNAVLELVNHYESGTNDWNLKTAGKAPSQNPTILAIAGKRGISYAEAEAFLANQFLAEME